MRMLIVMGGCYTIYGILGLIGIQRIPRKHRDRSWTLQYKRAQGISFLLLGASWCILYFAAKAAAMPDGWLLMALVPIVSVPSIVYSVLVDRKYKRYAE